MTLPSQDRERAQQHAEERAAQGQEGSPRNLAGRDEKDAERAFDDFLEKYGAKYPKACDCLRKERRELLAFYAFPAEHWQHLRTTNPIESTFATIRLRHRKTMGSGTRRTSLAKIFKLAQSAAKKWRRLSSHEKVTLVMHGRIFNDGILQDAA